LGPWVQPAAGQSAALLHRYRPMYRAAGHLTIPKTREFAVSFVALPPDAAVPLNDADLARLEALLDALPAPLQPLDICALDGYLCAVLLQPRRPGPAQWLPLVWDVEGRALPAGAAVQALQSLVQRRHAELDRAISTRQWFDPWIYQLDGDASPAECVLPWVAGFAAATEAFPDLMASPDPALIEPLALIFMHFDAEDLEDAEALLEVIETLEPPSDLGEAVQDLVRALMLIADVTRPRSTGTSKPATRPQSQRRRR
jgi:uncharacterized protein